jgi:hypothetical protein
MEGLVVIAADGDEPVCILSSSLSQPHSAMVLHNAIHIGRFI